MRNIRFLAITSFATLAPLTSLLGCVAGSDPGTTSGGSVSGTGAVPGSGGAGPSGGTTLGAGGSAPSGGGPSAGGSGTGSTSAGGAALGGSPAMGGNANPSGGSGNAGGGPSGGSGPDVDEMGKTNASPGSSTNAIQDYLRLGEIRLLNNNWGSAELGCNDTEMSVFVRQDKSFGWTFNRKACGTKNGGTDTSHPDFPQVEFGIHPFGLGNALATSPNFSSTTLLPLQVKDITSASVKVDGLTINLSAESSWNITFEFWLSERHPVTDPNPGVYAELMTFWGWQNGRWPEPPAGTGPRGDGAGTDVQAGDKTYKLWVQDDQWADGKWRYFQFRANDGPQKAFNGTVDVKKLLDYLVNSKGYSTDYWVTRLEVGSEIDDNTAGEVSMKGITFEVNGQSRSQVFGE